MLTTDFFALDMIDKAKEILGDADSVTRLREENLAVFKESQRVSKELDQVKLELSKAKEEITSLANKNASAVQDLMDQLSRRHDESTVVDENLLGKPFSNLRPQWFTCLLSLSPECLFLTLSLFVLQRHPALEEIWGMNPGLTVFWNLASWCQSC